MRLIGHLKTESSAKTLADYLVSIDVRTMIEPDAEGWGIWIYSEDQIEAGRQALSSFIQNPGDSRFRNTGQKAAAVAEREQRENEDYKQRLRTRNQIWVTSLDAIPVTMTLMLISIGVTLMEYPESTQHMVDWLMISQYRNGVLPEVRHGEVWRLITPIFIHFGPMHIIFNMLMLKSLGTMVESRRGSLIFVLLVIFFAIPSNLGQYFYNGPEFGGMSGVLYGLFGYIWMRGRSDPNSGLGLDPTTVAMMLIWFFLCLAGILGNVANVCHAVGLILGMLVGVAPLAKQIF